MSQGLRNWSHRLFHRLPAQGQPLGFSVAGNRRIVFRAAEQWPLREPFVFRWHARRQPGYRKYEGPRNTLVQAWNTGQRSHRLQSIGEPQHPVAGNPCLVHDAHRDQYYVAFRDANGHIHEATPNDGSWKVIDSTVLAGAPPAVSEPAGSVSTETGSRYYVYLADDGHLHELYFDGAWNQRDLQALQSSDTK
jgi:hypothetical protein